jgi:hypothetical protein
LKWARLIHAWFSVACVGRALRVRSQSRPGFVRILPRPLLSQPHSSLRARPAGREQAQGMGAWWGQTHRDPRAPPETPPPFTPRGRRLRHRHRLGGSPHVRDRVGWRGQVLGHQQLRPAGDWEQDGSDKPRGCARWREKKPRSVSVCACMRTRELDGVGPDCEPKETETETDRQTGQ